MKRLATRIGLAAALVAPMLLAAGPSAKVSAEGSTLPLAQCTTEHHSLSVLFLMDVSASLKQEDPFGLRVVGLEAAVNTLSQQLAAEKAADRKFSIYVDFLQFGSTTHRAFTAEEWPIWGQLGESSDRLQTAIQSFAERDTDHDTDYFGALDPWAGSGDQHQTDLRIGALDMLKKAPPESCRLLVWFTDGKFDFDPPVNGEPSPKVVTWSGTQISSRNEDAASSVIKDGTARLCAPGGPIDVLRSGDIYSGSGAQLAVVALGKPNRFGLINRMAADAESVCGTQPPRGSVFPAQNVDELIFNLQEAVQSGSVGASDTTIGTCPINNDCVTSGEIKSWDLPFTLTAGIGSFNLLALEGDRSVHAVLIDPNGESLPIDGLAVPAKMKNGTTVLVTDFAKAPSVHQVHADLPPNPASWAGQWRVRFVATGAESDHVTNKAAIYVFPGELEAHIRGADTVLRKGREGKFVVGLATHAGAVITKPDFMPETKIEAFINGTPVSTGTQRSDGSWEITYSVPKDYSATSVDVTANISAYVKIDETLPALPIAQWSGVKVGSIEVRPLPKYPTLDGPIAGFKDSISQKHKTISSTLDVVAPDAETGGCVSLVADSGATNSADELHASVKVFNGTTEVPVGAECAVRLAAGETKQLKIQVSIDKGSVTKDDALTGFITFKSVSALDKSQSAEFKKEFVVTVAPIFNYAPDWARAAYMTALAVLLALLVLYGLNAWSAKLDVPEGAYLVLPVRFSNNKLERIRNGEPQPFAFADDELHVMDMPRPGKRRHVEIGDVEFAGRVPALPFADVAGVATSGGAPIVVAGRGSSKKGNRGLLSASLKGAWAFVAEARPVKKDDVVQPVDGFLTLVVPSSPGDARAFVNGNQAEIRDRIADSLRGLAEAELDPETMPDRPGVPDQKRRHRRAQPKVPPPEPEVLDDPDPWTDVAGSSRAQVLDPDSDPFDAAPKPLTQLTDEPWG